MTTTEQSIDLPSSAFAPTVYISYAAIRGCDGRQLQSRAAAAFTERRTDIPAWADAPTVLIPVDRQRQAIRADYRQTLAELDAKLAALGIFAETQPEVPAPTVRRSRWLTLVALWIVHHLTHVMHFAKKEIVR